MTESTINFLQSLWQTLQGFAQPVFDFCSRTVTIAGNDYTVISLLFGGSVGVFLVYTLVTWVANLIT